MVVVIFLLYTSPLPCPRRLGGGTPPSRFPHCDPDASPMCPRHPQCTATPHFPQCNIPPPRCPLPLPPTAALTHYYCHCPPPPPHRPHRRDPPQGRPHPRCRAPPSKPRCIITPRFPQSRVPTPPPMSPLRAGGIVPPPAQGGESHWGFP